MLFADSGVLGEQEVGESQEPHLAGSVQGWGVRDRQVGSRRMECTSGNSRLCKVPPGAPGLGARLRGSAGSERQGSVCATGGAGPQG